MKYLLMAEADSIQRLVFNAVKLKEVRAGSNMLAQWCEEGLIKILEPLDKNKYKVLVNAGGNIVIVFEEEKDCKTVRRLITEDYYTKLGGSITSCIVKLQEKQDDSFNKGMKQAKLELNTKKRRPIPYTRELYNPFVEICTDCGEGIVEKRSDDEEGKWLCKNCFMRHKVAREIRLREDSKVEIDEIARADENKNVVHIVADGNNMGSLFNKLAPKELQEFSRELTQIIDKSIDEAVENEYVDKAIVAGDDIYLIVPAQESLQVIIRFVNNYRKYICSSKFIKEEDKENITIAVAAVMAKGTTPHALVYKRAHELLETVKQEGKAYGISSVGIAIMYKQTDDKNNVYSVGDLEDKRFIKLEEFIGYKNEIKELPKSRLYELVVILESEEDVEGKLAYLFERIKIKQQSQDEENRQLEKRLEEVISRLESKKKNETSKNKIIQLADWWDYIVEEEER